MLIVCFKYSFFIFIFSLNASHDNKIMKIYPACNEFSQNTVKGFLHHTK